jgi:hypothetical protein
MIGASTLVLPVPAPAATSKRQRRFGIAADAVFDGARTAPLGKRGSFFARGDNAKRLQAANARNFERRNYALPARCDDCEAWSHAFSEIE